MSPEQFFEVYRDTTGLKLNYDPLMHDSDLFLWQKKFEVADLKLVVAHIKKRYASKPEYVTSMMRWGYLIRQLDTFGELLAEAKAMGVKDRAYTPRERVLSQSGRPQRQVNDSAPPPVRQKVAEVYKRLTKEEMEAGFARMRAAVDAVKDAPTDAVKSEQVANNHEQSSWNHIEEPPTT